VASVLRATIEELARVGYSRLRVEAVAARSGVNKTTVYRRWPEKSNLVCAALRTVSGPPEDPDTGSVRDDLIASFRSGTRGWATERGRALLRVLAAERADPTVDRLARMLRERHVATRRLIVERGVGRRELPAGTDPDFLLEVLTSTIHTRVRQRTGPLDPSWLARVVDFALAGAGATDRASASRPDSSSFDSSDIAS
jgi:AcrR family transcriptional regulator